MTRNEIEKLAGMTLEEIANKSVSDKFLYATDSGWYPASLAEASKNGFFEDYLIEESQEIIKEEKAEKRRKLLVPRNRFEKDALQSQWPPSRQEDLTTKGRVLKKNFQMERLAKFFKFSTEKELESAMKKRIQYGGLNLRIYKKYIFFGGLKDSHGRNALYSLDREGNIKRLSDTISFGYGSRDKDNSEEIIDSILNPVEIDRTGMRYNAMWDKWEPIATDSVPVNLIEL